MWCLNGGAKERRSLLSFLVSSELPTQNGNWIFRIAGSPIHYSTCWQQKTSAAYLYRYFGRWRVVAVVHKQVSCDTDIILERRVARILLLLCCTGCFGRYSLQWLKKGQGWVLVVVSNNFKLNSSKCKLETYPACWVLHSVDNVCWVGWTTQGLEKGKKECVRAKE